MAKEKAENPPTIHCGRSAVSLERAVTQARRGADGGQCGRCGGNDDAE